MNSREVRSKLEKEVFGIFHVMLKEGFRNEWYLADNTRRVSGIIKVAETKGNNHSNWVLGLYDSREQLSERGFTLKIIDDITAFVPYTAIDSYKRIGDTA